MVKKCPICHKGLANENYKPFCSKRCADVDLGNWFGEKYAIEAVEPDETEIDELSKILVYNK